MNRPIAGLLLTGGASSRLGYDKARLVVGGEALALRVARTLGEACAPCLEVGPGVSGLVAVREDPEGGGPLVALVAGAAVLGDGGHRGDALLLAVDMPRVSADLLRLLIATAAEANRAEASGARATVPVAGGRLQPLCAVYSAAACDVAADLVAAGARSMHGLLDAIEVRQVEEPEWRQVAPAGAFDDIDTPADLAALGE